MKKPNNLQFDIHHTIISALQARQTTAGKTSVSPGTARRTVNAATAAAIWPISSAALTTRNNP